MKKTKNNITELKDWNYRPEEIQSLGVDAIDQFISGLLRKAHSIPIEKLKRMFLESCKLDGSNKNEHEKLDALQKAIQEKGYKLTENLDGKQETLWNSTLTLNGYSNFRCNVAQEIPDISSLSTIEMENALRYHWNEGDGPIDVIDRTMEALGFTDYSKVKEKVHEIFGKVDEEQKKQSKKEETSSMFDKSKGKQSRSPSGILLDDSDRKQPKVNCVAPYYKMVDSADDDKRLYFTPSEWKYPHVSIDFFHMPSLIILDDIIEIMNKDDNIILEPTDGGNLRTCTSGAVYIGRISFSVKAGDPIKIFKDIVNAINQKYGINAEFTKWRPFVDYGFIREECVDYLLDE